MANSIDISNEENKKGINVILRKSFQSARINFLIGSGCSVPAIKPLGDIEKKIQTLLEENKELEAEKTMFKFLIPIAKSNSKLTENNGDKDTEETLSKYKAFLSSIFQILTESKNNILPKQANIFCTNYDLFIEKASEKFGVAFNLHDGFNRNPRLDNQFRFSVTEFFNTISNIGNLYDYEVKIPSINLIKLHGSLSWEKMEEEIVFKVQNYLKKLEDNHEEIQEAKKNNDDVKLLALLKEFNNQFNIILPIKYKLRDTLLDRVYYNLLRIYANELDKENTLLIAEGISFEDEHILDITTKALRNPTLQLLIFCYQESDVERYESKFGQYNNVKVAYNSKEKLDFAEFNNIMKEFLQEDSRLEERGTSQQGQNNDK